MLVLRVEKWLLPLQASHVNSKEEEGKTKGKRDMPANSHASLRYGCHASSQPLFLISSLLQITKLLAPSLHADLN